MKKTIHHVSHPKAQARTDYSEGKDIGYNPYPIYSMYWLLYRSEWRNIELEGMEKQMTEDDEFPILVNDFEPIKSENEYLGVDHPQLLKHDEPMEDLG